jgi:transcriptional regulator with XRE-family HTH domain
MCNRDTDFGNFLKSRREKNPDISQRELARRTNLSPSYISRIENGEYIPSREVVIEIAKALGEDKNKFLLKAKYLPEGNYTVIEHEKVKESLTKEEERILEILLNKCK